jgi:hypothetical protein
VSYQPGTSNYTFRFFDHFNFPPNYGSGSGVGASKLQLIVSLLLPKNVSIALFEENDTRVQPIVDVFANLNGKLLNFMCLVNTAEF